MPREWDALVVGSGPNGLAAAIVLAEAGRSVLVLEARDTVGGACRTAELTLPGFHHDICSAIHPMALLSPLFRRLPLEQYGLQWIHPRAPLAHPLDDGTAAVLHRSVAATGQTLGEDGRAWTELLEPLVGSSASLVDELLKPIRIPGHPLRTARFGALALRSCDSVVRSRFRGVKARALFAGCSGHSFLPLDAVPSASFGLVLSLAGHTVGWPIARRGSQAIADSLAAHLRTLGGSIETSREVRTLSDLPPSRAVLFDTAPQAVVRLVGAALPPRYRRQLETFRRGPGVFKVDWALAGPIPWKAAACLDAATVHVGGTFEEIAASERDAFDGRINERPFVLVAQSSLFDQTRAPAGQHTGWAYCHVPTGSSEDMTERIERQIERFAPGFRDRIIARRTQSAPEIESYNPNLVGGDISGGANTLRQLVFRPAMRWNPYTTPNPRFFLCSASTPPGGGVHGMCGYGAAQSALATTLR